MRYLSILLLIRFLFFSGHVFADISSNKINECVSYAGKVSAKEWTSSEKKAWKNLCKFGSTSSSKEDFKKGNRQELSPGFIRDVLTGKAADYLKITASSVTIKDAVVNENLSLANKNIGFFIVFDSVIFNGMVNMSGTSFERGMDVINSLFMDELILIGAKSPLSIIFAKPGFVKGVNASYIDVSEFIIFNSYSASQKGEYKLSNRIDLSLAKIRGNVSILNFPSDFISLQGVESFSVFIGCDFDNKNKSFTCDNEGESSMDSIKVMQIAADTISLKNGFTLKNIFGTKSLSLRNGDFGFVLLENINASEEGANFSFDLSRLKYHFVANNVNVFGFSLSGAEIQGDVKIDRLETCSPAVFYNLSASYLQIKNYSIKSHFKQCTDGENIFNISSIGIDKGVVLENIGLNLSAIHGKNLHIGGDLQLLAIRDGYVVNTLAKLPPRSHNFVGATIGGVLAIDNDTHLDRPLFLQRVSASTIIVGHDNSKNGWVYLKKLDLLGSTLNGWLEIYPSFINELDMRNATINGNARIASIDQALEKIDASNASISGSLTVLGFSSKNSQAVDDLKPGQQKKDSCKSAQQDDDNCKPLEPEINNVRAWRDDSILILQDAKLSSFDLNTKNLPKCVNLNGASYDRIGGNWDNDADIEALMKWFQDNHKGNIQPYIKLAEVLNNEGLKEQARDVRYYAKRMLQEVASEKSSFLHPFDNGFFEHKWLLLQRLFSYGVIYLTIIKWYFGLLIIPSCVFAFSSSPYSNGSDKWWNKFFNALKYLFDHTLPFPNVFDEDFHNYFSKWIKQSKISIPYFKLSFSIGFLLPAVKIMVFIIVAYFATIFSDLTNL